jgi:hypothetical protein
LKPNHIFIFCDNHNEVMNELLEFGFIEGSNRIHPNQGTRNRKFYFNDFYIEILWVHNIDEALNDMTVPTKLYERSRYKTSGYSPFGLCVDYSKDDNMLFENCFIYKPIYLPENMAIEVLKNEDAKTLPWTFRWNTDLSNNKINEPINLKNKNLSQVVFGVDTTKIENNYLNLFKSDIIIFKDSKSEFLKLIFDGQNSKATKVFTTIPLIIEY